MLEVARGDARGLDERLDLALLEADDPAELVGRKLALVDQAVEGADRHPQPPSRFARAHPANVVVWHAAHCSQESPFLIVPHEIS
ncbi:MAG: hypothetical protein AVDCRST_MAG10-1177 [uncultured Acidimicrobiales bacterium]|uniref:Uncharacterized protein n=1 Tax=uncultured Acidimicrobiales bacterium TaxID=310071 RepID=A0A6J4HS39_9ACTN|nr:MAG: hypothetical protein AVDCRST_MAG10-1177 [uncultured Acidimicrobiales bacterium]